MFRTVPLPIIRSFSLYTQQRYMSYRFADILRAGSGWNCVPSWSCLQAVSKPVWHILLLCVQWKTPDDGQRNCPKHVEFHSKNKFEKLVHLVGVIIRNLTRCTVTWTSKFWMSLQADLNFTYVRDMRSSQWCYWTCKSTRMWVSTLWHSEGTMILRNIWNCSPNDTTLYPRRLES